MCHKHKSEPKHVYIRLEMLSSTYLSIKSIQMDIFPRKIPQTSQGRRIFFKVDVFSQGGRMGYPVCIGDPWDLFSEYRACRDILILKMIKAETDAVSYHVSSLLDISMA